jgi:hypothetical protein
MRENTTLAEENSPTAVLTRDIMDAIHDFVNAEDLDSKRQILEERKALLFREEVETIFEQNITQARASGEQRNIEILEAYLTLLRMCKANGIGPTFEELVAQEDDLPFDPELIPRSITAFSSGPEEKTALVQYLAAQAAQSTDKELKELINTIQLALLGGDYSQLGQNLSGIYQQAWKSIMNGVEKR